MFLPKNYSIEGELHSLIQLNPQRRKFALAYMLEYLPKAKGKAIQQALFNMIGTKGFYRIKNATLGDNYYPRIITLMNIANILGLRDWRDLSLEKNQEVPVCIDARFSHMEVSDRIIEAVKAITSADIVKWQTPNASVRINDQVVLLPNEAFKDCIPNTFTIHMVPLIPDMDPELV